MGFAASRGSAAFWKRRVREARLGFLCRPSHLLRRGHSPGGSRRPLGAVAAAVSSGTCSGGLTAAATTAFFRATRGRRLTGTAPGQLPPRVKDRSSASARGCPVGMTLATATPAKGRQRPAARSCLFKQTQSGFPPAAPGRKRRWVASPGSVGRGLGKARHRSCARGTWRPPEVRGREPAWRRVAHPSAAGWRRAADASRAPRQHLAAHRSGLLCGTAVLAFRCARRSHEGLTERAGRERIVLSLPL
ncbi:uncharacterized protein LOC135183016 [Pogoniulus pusillus]|uniref:uncharacterized protein LOC135183016 n=1 Tax=Pogoniulus pusillus TaxID=488313 RepID=UPI0030B98FD2